MDSYLLSFICFWCYLFWQSWNDYRKIFTKVEIRQFYKLMPCKCLHMMYVFYHCSYLPSQCLSSVSLDSCRENCSPRKRISGRIIFNASCVEFCNSPYGSVQYKWHMYKVIDEDAVNVSDRIDLSSQKIDLEEVQDLETHAKGGK